MKIIVTILPVFLFKVSFSQHREVSVTADEGKKGILYHYQITDDYASAHIYILSDNRFRFESYWCMGSNYSEGTYQQTKKELVFTSYLQKGTLPVRIEYRKKDVTDTLIKKISFIRDIEGREINEAFVNINNDSTICFYGDLFCTKEFGSIDSIKVVLENGASSNWIKVAQGNDVLQIILQTRADLSNYVIYNSRFRKKGRMLEKLE